MLDRRARIEDLDDLQEVSVDLNYFASTNPAFGKQLQKLEAMRAYSQNN